MVSLVGGGILPTTPRATGTSVARANSTSGAKRTSSGADR